MKDLALVDQGIVINIARAPATEDSFSNISDAGVVIETEPNTVFVGMLYDGEAFTNPHVEQDPQE